MTPGNPEVTTVAGTTHAQARLGVQSEGARERGSEGEAWRQREWREERGREGETREFKTVDNGHGFKQRKPAWRGCGEWPRPSPADESHSRKKDAKQSLQECTR